jgi:hypothetical protein
MGRTAPEPTFGYSVVEKALMAVHGFSEESRKAFRGRLIHLQRLKVVSAAPGKGHRIAYRREDIFRWAVALEFAEFGIDPTETRKILDLSWPRVAQIVLDAKARGRDKYLFFHPHMLGRFAPADERETSRAPGAPNSVTIAIITDLAKLGQMAKAAEARASLERFQGRYGMINLTRLRREVEASLTAFSAIRN